jgi:hypothetical protein
MTSAKPDQGRIRERLNTMTAPTIGLHSVARVTLLRQHFTRPASTDFETLDLSVYDPDGNLLATIELFGDAIGVENVPTEDHRRPNLSLVESPHLTYPPAEAARIAVDSDPTPPHGIERPPLVPWSHEAELATRAADALDARASERAEDRDEIENMRGQR